MAQRFGSINIECDAPAYAIVKACHKIGLRTPEDVCWYRYPNYVNGHAFRRGLFRVGAWKGFLGLNSAQTISCVCGHALPALEKFTFTFLSGREEHYYLGQCTHCRAIFWDRG